MTMQSYSHKIFPTESMGIFDLAARAISARNTFGKYDMETGSYRHMSIVDCHYGKAANARLSGMRLSAWIEAGEPEDAYPKYGTVYDGWRS